MTTYILGGIVGQNFKYYLMKYTEPPSALFNIGVFVLIVQFGLFVAFTFNPPKIEYFKDSIKGTYGI